MTRMNGLPDACFNRLLLTPLKRSCHHENQTEIFTQMLLFFSIACRELSKCEWTSSVILYGGSMCLTGFLYAFSSIHGTFLNSVLQWFRWACFVFGACRVSRISSCLCGGLKSEECVLRYIWCFQGHNVAGLGRGGVGMAERARPLEALQPCCVSSHRDGDPKRIPGRERRARPSRQPPLALHHRLTVNASVQAGHRWDKGALN